MAINFPNTTGQATDGSFTHTDLNTGITWSWNGTSWASLGVDATTAVTVLSGIGLTDLSVSAPSSASGSGNIAYDNTTGVFTYVPPDFTTINFSDLANRPTTLGGYGITDAFSGDYNTLINKPTIPTDVSGLTDTTGVIPTVLTDLNIVDGLPSQVLTTDGAGNFTFEDSQGAGEVYDQSLNTTDDVQFARVTADDFVKGGTGPYIISSASYTQIDAQDGVRITGLGAFRLPNLTTTARDLLIAENGDMIYNTTDSKIQAYQNGSWINIDDGTVA
jgi:hypothetical protein